MYSDGRGMTVAIRPKLDIDLNKQSCSMAQACRIASPSKCTSTNRSNDVVPHSLPSLQRSAAYVRLKHYVIQVKQAGGHLRFICEHVQGRPCKSPILQASNQFHFVDHASPRHVYNHPFRAKRFQHWRIDQA